MRRLFSIAVIVGGLAISAAHAQPSSASFAFEPQTRAYIEAEAKRPPTAGLDIAQIRDGYVASLKRTSVAPDPRVTAQDVSIPGPVGAIAARVYTPPGLGGRRTGLLLYIHGGGFAAGDLDSHDALARLIARRLHHRVMTIAYRRAPEAQYPAARDDAVAAFGYVVEHAGDLNVDPERIAIGGESAGGTHAFATTLALMTGGGAIKPRALWTFVPALDGANTTSTYTTFAQGAGRTADEFRFLWSLYAPKDLARTDPGLSPFYADPKLLPPTFIYTAEFDPVRDDGEVFAARAKAAGATVRVRRERGLIHQFPEITGVSTASRDAVVRATRDLRGVLAR